MTRIPYITYPTGTKHRKRSNIRLREQKRYGVGLLILSGVMILVSPSEATAVLVTIPLALLLLFSKRRLIN